MEQDQNETLLEEYVNDFVVNRNELVNLVILGVTGKPTG